MKKALLLFSLLWAGFTVKPCSCEDDFFCRQFDPQGTTQVFVYGHKLADIDTSGITFKVMGGWGPFSGGDTITIWNDSAVVWAPLMGPGVPFQCSHDTKGEIGFGDTVLLHLGVHYAGAAYSSPGDYLFLHIMCEFDILKVRNNIVSDTKGSYPPAPVQVIEESLNDYVDRLINRKGCRYTKLVGIEENKNAPDLAITVSHSRLQLSGTLMDAEVRVNLYNIFGQLVYSQANTDASHDLSSLASALYIVEVVQQGRAFRRKVMLP